MTRSSASACRSPVPSFCHGEGFGVRTGLTAFAGNVKPGSVKTQPLCQTPRPALPAAARKFGLKRTAGSSGLQLRAGRRSDRQSSRSGEGKICTGRHSQP
ncbi:hypothetical protein Q5P01_008687 [Channa striata]|uniref:Uncharacterized protein n=1 Tax=Channa striata TaxID=64152 RepID=A0AA88SUA0_CHASR|nr:hypothetical protein Q5P01_008687 [Channa striata]